jgi:2-methylisocitrate lyase-like PEP mutase family enzyme
LGSARLLAIMGIEVLATTIVWFAHSLGRLEGEVSRDEAFEHYRSLCAAVKLPVSADLENYFAHESVEAAANTFTVSDATHSLA